MKLNARIDIRIGTLFMRQDYVQSVACATRLARPSVRCLHDAWASAGQSREAGFREFRSDLARHFVIGVRRFESRRTENSYCRSHLIKTFERSDKLVMNALQSRLFLFRRARLHEPFAVGSACGR